MNLRNHRWPGPAARRALPLIGAALATVAVLVASVAAPSPSRTLWWSTAHCPVVPTVEPAAGGRTPTIVCIAPAPSTGSGAWPQPAAGDRLRELADRLTETLADRQTGRYSYHHLRRWILDTTGTPAPRPDTAAVVALDQHRWVADDGSGVEIAIEIGPDFQLTAANPDHRGTDAEFAGHPAVRTVHPAGHMGSPIAGPLATDPAGLARQLEFDSVPDGPADTLTAVDMLYTTHHPARPVRATALQVLAGLPGLTYRPVSNDRIGRRGIAISLDHRNVRYALTFDPTTGDLLAAEQRLTGPHGFLPVPAGQVVYYTLFLDHGRRTAPGTAPRIDRQMPRSACRVHSG